MARLIIPAKNLIARTNRQKASAPIIPGLSLPGNIREGRSWVRWRGAVKAARPRHRLIRRQTSHCEEFGEAARQGFCGSTATALDGSGIARKLADCRQLSGSSTAQKSRSPPNVPAPSVKSPHPDPDHRRRETCRFCRNGSPDGSPGLKILGILPISY